MSTLETEIRTYNEKLPELLSHVGKYVLIHQKSIEGYFESYSDALRVGYERFADKRFLVKRIAPAEVVSYFTRDVSFECRV